MSDRPPLPPFTAETAAAKVQAAEDAWNSRVAVSPLTSTFSVIGKVTP